MSRRGGWVDIFRPQRCTLTIEQLFIKQHVYREQISRYWEELDFRGDYFVIANDCDDGSNHRMIGTGGGGGRGRGGGGDMGGRSIRIPLRNKKDKEEGVSTYLRENDGLGWERVGLGDVGLLGESHEHLEHARLGEVFGESTLPVGDDVAQKEGGAMLDGGRGMRGNGLQDLEPLVHLQHTHTQTHTVGYTGNVSHLCSIRAASPTTNTKTPNPGPNRPEWPATGFRFRERAAVPQEKVAAPEQRMALSCRGSSRK